MTKHEWMGAGLLAALVAAMMLASTTLPKAWAEEQATQVTIPELPAASLGIPSIAATVTATATPNPGKPVTIALEARFEESASATAIPLTISVTRSEIDFTAMMSRVAMPATTPQKAPDVLTRVNTTLRIDADGKASASVELPLTWAKAEQEKSEVQITTDLAKMKGYSYQLLLSSTLNGESTPFALAPVFNVETNGRTNLNNLSIASVQIQRR